MYLKPFEKKLKKKQKKHLSSFFLKKHIFAKLKIADFFTFAPIYIFNIIHIDESGRGLWTIYTYSSFSNKTDVNRQ